MKKPSRTISVLFVILLLTFFICLAVGRYPVPLPVLFKVLTAKIIPMEKTWPDTIETVIFRIRLPRIVGAVLVGASLSLAGAVYQGMFKNPLVSPDILGVAAGGAFGASLAILLSFSAVGIQITAFAFGILAVSLVYLLSISIKGERVISLVIIGILVGSLFTSFTSLVKYTADTQDKLPTITFWLMGSLTDLSPEDVRRVFGPILLGMIPIYILRWKLNVLSMEEEEAKTLGLNTAMIRTIVIISSTLMTAAAVSISGIVGWIGLAIPHLSRRLVGADYRVLVPMTILTGSIYLLIIDTLARSLASVEIPLGILTSLIGAPFLMLLLLKQGRRWDR